MRLSITIKAKVYIYIFIPTHVFDFLLKNFAALEALNMEMQ